VINGAGAAVDGRSAVFGGHLSDVDERGPEVLDEGVPVFVEFEVAVPHLRPAGW
jgi:hypothetical protein